MSFRTILSVFVAYSLCVLNVAAQSYSIANYNAIGTGCPKGTVYGVVGPNNQGLTLKYNAFTASVGPNTDPSDSRKNCQATISVNVPSGWQFAFKGFTYNGGYTLQPGTKSTYETHYYFQSQLAQGDGSGTVNGAGSDGACTFSHPVNQVWSPCGQNAIVGVDSSVITTNGDGNASGQLTLNTLYIPSSAFVWRTC